MKLNTQLFLLFCTTLFFSCKNGDVIENDTQIESSLDELIIRSKNFQTEKELLEIEKNYQEFRDLHADSLLKKLNAKNQTLLSTIELAKKLDYVSLVNKQGTFASKGSKYTELFYGLKNDSIRIHFDADKRIKSLKIIEEQSGRQLKSISKNEFDYTFDVYFDNPFSITIEFVEEAYFNLSVERRPYSLENKFAKCEIKTDSIESNKKLVGYEQGTRLKYEKVFNEPKKFVVSKSLSFSGESKVYAAIELPPNTVEFIYTLRISGDSDKLKEDGTLYNQVDKSYRKIKMLGLPIWESEGSQTSLTREILNSIFKPKVDHYALNIFFFDREKEIKKFINYSGSDYASAFAYDINNSAISSESRTGLVKKPKSGYSYIGLQTTSTFSDTYAWLDAVALYEVKYYYKLKRKLIRK